MTVNAHLGLECDECGAQVVPGLWKVGDDCRHCPGHIRVPPSSASVPPELPTLSDEEMDAMKRSGLYAHGDARVARLLERAIALRAEVAALKDEAERVRSVHLGRHTRLAEALGMDPSYSVDATIDEAIRRAARSASGEDTT